MLSINKKYTALVIAALLVSLLGLAQHFSCFSVFNGYSYDVLMRSFPSTTASEKIIVVEMEADYAQSGDEVWLELLQQLLESEAGQIAFSLFPQQASVRFYQTASDSGKTVFGAHIAKPSEDSIQGELVLPNAALDKKIIYGLITSPPSQHGVYRQQHSIIQANGLSLPSFEKRAAEQALDNTEQLPQGDFRINFIGNQNRIPTISIDRILSGGLINELVSGRTVLIGVNQHEKLSQFYTPVSTDQQLTSEVMLHAFALDTLLSERQISDLPSWAFLLLISLITIVSLFLGQWLAFQMSLRVSFSATLLYIVICWLALHQGSIWIPLTELLLAQWLSFALVWCYRINQEHQSLEQMLFGFPLKSRESTNPVSIYNADEPWEQLIAMINQSLHLSRVIFLERVPGDHRLKEIKAMNCNINDIREKRRDYERFPYSTAISENRPVLLDRPYLKLASSTEQQYMAPLIFAGEVLGFWVYTVEPEKITSQVKFNSLTYSFMVQVSEILHYRQEWQKRTNTEHNKFWSYLRIEGAEQLQQLNQSSTLMDKRIFELQGVFNSINTSCILYDLFGRVLMVNTDMNELAQQANLLLFKMSMLEFVIEITDFDESGARNILQRITFDHEAISIPVTHRGINRSFMLHIRPLRYQDEKMQHDQIPDESQVFQISGVLCELVDMTELKRLYQLKEQMFERFSFQVRNDLTSILYALPTLENEKSKEYEELFVLKTIRGKFNEILSMLDQVSEQMEVDVEHMLTNNSLCYPVDARVSIQNAIDFLQEALDQRQIQLRLELPELINLVFASPLELEVVLQSVMLAMIDDTYEADEIFLEVVEQDHYLTCYIHNNGIGMSDNKLQTLNDPDLAQDSELLGFHYAIRCVNRWGGSLNISSEMGEGSNATLVLKCFL